MYDQLLNEVTAKIGEKSSWGKNELLQEIRVIDARIRAQMGVTHKKNEMLIRAIHDLYEGSKSFQHGPGEQLIWRAIKLVVEEV
jgi:hypothetical protein